MIRRRVIVRGQVQGVFFRDSCRREAQARHVAGSVRNRSDGAVEAVFEGAESDVLAMCRWCETGTRYAVVETTEVVEENLQGLSGFHVE
jgi:acylphosphatase